MAPKTSTTSKPAATAKTSTSSTAAASKNSALQVSAIGTGSKARNPSPTKPRPAASTASSKATTSSSAKPAATATKKAEPCKSAIDSKKKNPPASSPTLATAEHSRDKNHVSNFAVSLHWLVNIFLKEHPEIRSKLLTTGAVTYDLIKAAVKDRGCRLVELIDSIGAVSKGKSFYFISHGWGRPFVELVDQVIEHFKPENQAIWRKGSPILPWAEIYVWLDIFAINQNEGACQGDDLAHLKEVVEDADQTLMILDKEGSVLTRIWCLFEAWHSGKHSGRKGKDGLKLLAYNVIWEELEKVFIDLDVAKAKATVIEDRDRILADIAADVGIQKMTHQLKDALVNSVTSSIPPDDEDHPWTELLGYELYKAGRICHLYGKFLEAEKLFRRDLKGIEKVLGPDDPKTLTSSNNLATVLKDLGKLDEAELLYKGTSSITAVGNLAMLLQSQGRLLEAEPLYREQLALSEATNGPLSPDTLTLLSNLASLVQDQGKLGEAEVLTKKALDGYMATLGSKHPHTIGLVNNLASLLQDQGKLVEAQPLAIEALESFGKILGPDHPNTLSATNNLANLYVMQGRLAEAEGLVKKALEGYERVFGPGHPDTENVKNGLTVVQQMIKAAK